MKTKEDLKLYFENGDKPTQEQFWAWLDSYWHKDEKIPDSSIDSVEKVIPVVTDGVLSGHSVSVFIQKDIKKIKQSAFQYTGLNYQISEVYFNEGLEEIGSYAFQSQNLKKIKTPSTLKTIGNGAFDSQGEVILGLDSLEEIILNNGLTKIGDVAFNCLRAKVKHLYIPNSVQSVGQNAFALPSLETVSALRGLDLSNAGIPESATITFRFEN